MRLIFGCLVTAFILGMCNSGFAQINFSVIKGSVILNNRTPASSSTIILLNLPDSSVAMSALVGTTGNFEFLNVKPGNYVLLATKLGYPKKYSKKYVIDAGGEITADPVMLEAPVTQLSQVDVIAKKPFVEVKPGKTIINPQASITADGKNVLDILRQSPGVRVDNNDNISISGRQNALILIDGKTINMTGTDLAAVLSSTQGSTVDRMELITGGSAKYDAAAGGVINIILKKGQNTGTNGTLTLSGGYGKYYKSNGGITFNNRSEHLNIFGSYSAIVNKVYKTFSNDRNIAAGGVTSSYNLTYTSVQDLITHNYRLGIDYSLSTNHTLGILVYGFVNNNDFVKNNHLNIASQGRLDSVILVNSTVDRDLKNINYNINYYGKLDKAGKSISASFTYSPYTRHSNEYINNQFNNAAGNMYRNNLLLQNLSPADRQNYTGELGFSNPVSKTSRLDIGVKLSHTKSNNNLIFGPYVNGGYTIDPAFSNMFVYTEDRKSGFVNYNAVFGKFNLEAGLRGEYTHSEGNSVTSNLVTPLKYFKLFPTALLSYHYNEKNEYTISFTRGISRPDYESLNPFLYYIDPYNYQTGNPYLKPEYTNTVKITHTYDQSITTSLYGIFTTDANFPFFQQNDMSKVSLYTSGNLGRSNIYGAEINAPVVFTSWWNANFNADASYQRYRIYPEIGKLDKGTGDLRFSSAQKFNISKSVGAEISGEYETPTFYGIRSFKAYYYVNAGIAVQMLNKQGKLSLNVSDIFNTSRDRAYTNFQNLDLRFYSKLESRIARLTFTYRFGKTSVKSASKHDTGNEDEQRRMLRN